jgi:hypothetical protein
VYSVNHNWPIRGPVRVVFGAPANFPASATYEEVTSQIENALRNMAGHPS